MTEAFIGSSALLGPLETSAEVAAMFDDVARLRGMLDFEAALARAEARVGVIPDAAAVVIAKHCRAELFDLKSLGAAAALAGIPTVPMVKSLTTLVQARYPEAARYVHWGSTTQDVMDTGLVLQLRDFLAWLRPALLALCGTLADLAEREAKTPIVGRTWLQQALPTTFGLKAAGWLDGLHRHLDRLDALLPRLLVVQMGGAVGTLASLGKEGDAVGRAVAEELGLGLPDMPWHGQRDRLVELAAWLGLIVGSLGKMARDLSLMTQTEVGEAFEPAGQGRGGSSTMPHKRNPVACAAILAAATRAPGLVATMLAAMPQEHERGLGGWQAEWSTLPELCRLAGGSMARAREIIEGLDLDRRRMRANLDLTKGQIMAEAVMMALGDRLGRLEAHHRVGEACRRAAATGRDLGAVIAEDEVLGGMLEPGELERLMDPGSYVGMAEAMVARVVERWRAR